MRCMKTFRLTVFTAFLYSFAIAKGLSSVALPHMPPLVKVADGEKYKDIVLKSDLVKTLTEWKLEEVGDPMHFDGSQWPVYVTLEYNLPRSYSSLGLQYHVPLRFGIISDTISNLTELWNLAGKMKPEIETFEKEAAVAFFVRVTGTTKVIRRRETFHTSIKDSNYISYNNVNDSLESFVFFDPVLIDGIELFVPLTAPIEQVKELNQNVGIDRLDQCYSKLQVYVNQRRQKKYRGGFTYEFSRGIISEFSLPNDFVWVTFPDIARAHRIVEEELLKEDFLDCQIAVHSYTKGSYHPGHLAICSITFPLKCGGQIKSCTASLRLFSDGTYDRLKIQLEYCPNPAHNH